MKALKSLLIFGLLFFSQQTLKAQTSQQKAVIVENVLNTIINSARFDSVNNNKNIYFAYNDFVNAQTKLNLHKKDGQVLWIDIDSLPSMEKYYTVADFTTNWADPKSVRVQLSIGNADKTVNIIMKKNEKGLWDFYYFSLIDN